MSHVHIALVGAQPIPIFLGIKSQNPDKVYFIVSQRTSSVAERVGSLIGIKDSHLVEFPPVDLTVIRQKIETLAANIEEGDTVSVNLVGGTKHWTIAFFDYFSKFDNARILLVDQNNKIVNYKTGESSSLSSNMQTLFQLFGHAPIGYLNIGCYSDRDAIVARDAWMAWTEYGNDFTNVTSGTKSNTKDLSKALQKKSGSYKCDGNILTWSDPHTVKISFNDGYEVVFNSPNALKLVTMTGWFEYLVGFRIAQWENSKEVRLNCQMTEIRDKKDILNEFDIVAYTGTKLLFVECKTNIYKLTDIDKFAKGIRTYGGTGSKGIFITYYPVSDQVKKKLKLNKIPHYQYKQDNQQELFDLLNKIHNEINEG